MFTGVGNIIGVNKIVIDINVVHRVVGTEGVRNKNQTVGCLPVGSGSDDVVIYPEVTSVNLHAVRVPDITPCAPRPDNVVVKVKSTITGHTIVGHAMYPVVMGNSVAKGSGVVIIWDFQGIAIRGINVTVGYFRCFCRVYALR